MGPSQPPILGHDVDELIHRSNTTTVFRSTTDHGPVVIKAPTDPHPSLRDLARYQWAFDLATGTDARAVVRHLAIERVGATVALVMEDLGGSALDECIPAGGVPVSRWLALAARLADALARLHAAGVVHRDIKPANVLVTADDEVRLLDLGLALRRRRGTAEVADPDRIVGTLAYMSPEQGGRLRAQVDARSDLYSLGVTLFELATGTLPFRSDSAAELAHAHVARRPPNLRELDGSYPPVLADIVDRLLAKDPGDRYASARGLHHDLEHASAELHRSGTVRAFPIGEVDAHLDLRLPERLYGRDAERARLLDAVAAALHGERVLVTVGGPSGIGKTALVDDVRRHPDASGVQVCSGKFDQFGQDQPYLGLVEALQDLLRHELSRDDDQVRARREDLAAALGGHGRLLTSLVPDLEALVGPQPEVEALPAEEAALRMHVLLGSFLSVFATADRPLMVFLDDMQWADPATLRLVEALVDDPSLRHLILVVGYRSNEVGAGHPLRATLDVLDGGATQRVDLVLGPLRPGDVTALVADTLRSPAERVAALARRVHDLAGGNAFFVREYLLTLHERGFFTHDGRAAWKWDLDRIDDVALPDTAAGLVAERLDGLPPRTLDLLDTASCVGSAFDLATLATVHGRDPGSVASDLEPAVHGGVIVPLDDLHRVFGSLVAWGVSADDADRLGTARYRFQHDRVRETVHERLDEQRRARRHGEIGRVLLHSLSPEELDRRVVEVFTHVVDGLGTSDDSDDSDAAERSDLARLGLEAGRRAQRALAFDGARRMLLAAESLLSDDAWTSDYETAIGIAMALAQCAYALELHEELEQRVDLVVDRARTAAERAEAHGLRIRVRHVQQRDAEAIDIGVEVAASLGVRLPRSPRLPQVGMAVARSLWGQRGLDPTTLVSLGEAEDDEIRAAVSLLTSVANPAYFEEPNLMPLIGMTTTRLAIRHGTTPQSPYGFAVWALVLCGALGRIDTGYAFGQLAVDVGHRYGGTDEARARFVVDCFIRHWKEPLPEIARLMHDDWVRNRDAGDAESATYCAGVALYSHFLGGGPIDDVPERYADPIRHLETCDHVVVKDCFLAWVDLLTALAGDELPDELSGDHVFYPTLLEEVLRAENGVQIAIASIAAGVLDHLAGRFTRAEERFAIASEWEDGIVSQVLVPGLAFFRARNAYRLLRSANGPVDRRRIRSVARRGHRRIRRWALFAPSNLAHRLDLLDAEEALAGGRTGDGLVALHRAVEHAGEAGALLYDALAHRRIAEVLDEEGAPASAAVAAGRAADAFSRWGSPALAEAVRTQVRTTGNRPSTSDEGTTGEGMAGIDLESLFDAVAAVTGDIDEGALLERLMPTMLRAAGADRGLLLLDSDGEPWVEAESELGEVEVRRRRLDDSTVLSRRALALARRSAEVVVVHDAGTSPLLDGEDEVRGSGVASILVVPITLQGRRLGVIYLENHVVRGAFTESRVEVTRALSAQAATAIENARLYGRVREALEVQTELTEANRRFVPREFVSGLGMESITEVELNVAIEREMNVLFADIRSFTSLSLELGAKGTVAMLNRYLSHVQPAIAVHGGFVGLYLGDGLLALFPDSVDDALNACFAMSRGLEGYNRDRGEHPELAVGVGMHSGPVTMGTIGDPDHLQCGVFGDTVNVASRMEGLTKHFGAPMVVSEATHGRLRDPDRFLLRPLGRVVVVGHQRPMAVHEGTGCHPEPVQEVLRRTLPTYLEALDRFRAGRFRAARDGFAACVDACPADTVAAAFVERCSGRPDGEWDGVERPGKGKG